MRDVLPHSASTDKKALLLNKSATVVSHWCFHCIKTVASSNSGIVGKASGRLVTRFRSFYLISTNLHFCYLVVRQSVSKPKKRRNGYQKCEN